MSRRHCSRAPAPPLEDEDLLQEILLRLSPMPSSLPRSSLVCKNWRTILSDHQFLKRFRKHHRKAPLLGFFAKNGIVTNYSFHPILDSPDRILSTRFLVPRSDIPYESERWIFTGCRHGLATLVCPSRREIVVWDPLTTQQHCVTFPPGIDHDGSNSPWNVAVLCADAADGHVHGDCFLGPFKLVLICERYMQAFTCLYELLSGVWGNVVSTETTAIQPNIFLRPSILVGNALCWLIAGGHILAFDLVRQSLGVIEKPIDAHVTGNIPDVCCFQLLRMENAGLGLAVLSELTVQLWERRSNCDGIVGWVLQKNILLEGLLPRGVHSDDEPVHFAGYDEDANVSVLSTMIGNFTLQLDSMMIRHIIKRNQMSYNSFYTYRNFYTAGIWSSVRVIETCKWISAVGSSASV